MIPPFVNFPDKENPDIFEYKGQSYKLEIKSKTIITPQQRILLTQQAVKLLNATPQLAERENLAYAEINKKKIKFSDKQEVSLTQEQKQTYQEIENVAKKQLQEELPKSKDSSPTTQTIPSSTESEKSSLMTVPPNRLYKKRTPYSKLAKVGLGIKLLLNGLGDVIFKRFKKAYPHYPQSTDPVLIAHHTGYYGDTIATEKVTRYPSVQNLIASKEAQSEYTQDSALIKRLDNDLENYRGYHNDLQWVTSNQLRDDYKDGLITTDSYVPAIVNSRMHEIKVGDETIKIHRSGAITYMPDGSESLPELKTKFIQKLYLETGMVWKGPDYDGVFQAIAKSKKSKELMNDLKHLQLRENALIDQMVQYVANQVEAHIQEVADPNSQSVSRLTGILQMTQVSLLDPSKAKTPGLNINEGNQMNDMAEIFRMFNGKKIEFVEGIKAPFYSDGVIKLPKEMVKNIPDADVSKPFTLSCTYFNINVDKNKVAGNQREINQAAISHLEAYLAKLRTTSGIQATKLQIKVLEQKLYLIQQRIKKGENTYELAKDILLLVGWKGTMCFSGKDRTQNLINTVINECMSQRIDQIKNWPGKTKKDKEALKSRLRTDLMENTSIGPQIDWENTSFRYLKVKGFNVIGLDKGEGLAGLILRIGYAAKAWSSKV